MVKAMDKLTQTDVTELRTYAKTVGGGIRWKGKLRHSWESGIWDYRVPKDTCAHLQHMRNMLGTAWLSKFNFA